MDMVRHFFAISLKHAETSVARSRSLCSLQTIDTMQVADTLWRAIKDQDYATVVKQVSIRHAADENWYKRFRGPEGTYCTHRNATHTQIPQCSFGNRQRALRGTSFMCQRDPCLVLAAGETMVHTAVLYIQSPMFRTLESGEEALVGPEEEEAMIAEHTKVADFLLTKYPDLLRECLRFKHQPARDTHRCALYCHPEPLSCVFNGDVDDCHRPQVFRRSYKRFLSKARTAPTLPHSIASFFHGH